MRRPGFFVKKEGIIAENARFEGLTRLKDACRVDVCGCLYGRIGFGAFPPRERVPGVFALCRTAASEGWNAWFPLSGGQGCEAPDAGVSGAYRGGGMSGLRVTRTTSRTMCGGRSVPSFGCSVPDRSAVGSSGRCEMLGGFVGQVVCAGIAGPDRCVQPRGSVDCRLPGLPGLSGRSGLSGLACPICPVCVRFARLVRLVRLFRVVRFLPVRLLSVRTARPVRSVCSARCGPSRPAFRSGRPLLLFVYSSRPAFSVPPGLLCPVRSFPNACPVGPACHSCCSLPRHFFHPATARKVGGRCRARPANGGKESGVGKLGGAVWGLMTPENTRRRPQTKNPQSEGCGFSVLSYLDSNQE